MADTPDWLSKYVESAEKIQKQRQAQRAKAEAAQARMLPVRNPVLPPVPKAAKTQQPGRSMFFLIRCCLRRRLRQERRSMCRCVSSTRI
jgi:hypothetical protein